MGVGVSVSVREREIVSVGVCERESERPCHRKQHFLVPARSGTGLR